ncbi:hypothetical protein GCM10027088_09250 [Nocardia goodfellowii]
MSRRETGTCGTGWFDNVRVTIIATPVASCGGPGFGSDGGVSVTPVSVDPDRIGVAGADLVGSGIRLVGSELLPQPTVSTVNVARTTVFRTSPCLMIATAFRSNPADARADGRADRARHRAPDRGPLLGRHLKGALAT